MNDYIDFFLSTIRSMENVYIVICEYKNIYSIKYFLKMSFLLLKYDFFFYKKKCIKIIN